MKLDVLAIGAHRDDVELSCGGTLIKLIDQGKKVGIVDCTQGESGTRGSAKERAEEAENASKTMGLKARENLRIPDAWITNTSDNQRKLIRILRKYQPDVVLLPYWEARHPDHYKTSVLGYEACFLAGLENLKVPGKAYRPDKIIYYLAFQETEPSFIVDITKEYKKKVEVIKCYRTQFSDSDIGKHIFKPRKDFFDLLEARARVCGSLINKKYGEAFLLKKPLDIEDITEIKGKFI